MDDKILASLIQILQKHADSIRTLNIAVADHFRLVAERTGVSYEEFEREFQASLESVAKSRPPHDPQRVAKEIEETVDELIFLRRLAKKSLN